MERAVPAEIALIHPRSFKSACPVAGLVFLLSLIAPATPVCAMPFSVDLFPYSNPDVLDIPADQPWGFVRVAVHDNKAYFEVGIYDQVLSYVEPGVKPKVTNFWFNYDGVIRPGDVEFLSPLPWVTNPTDTPSGNREPFDYQMFVGYGFGEQVLKFTIANLPNGTTEEDFLQAVPLPGWPHPMTEFRIAAGDLGTLPNGGPSGAILIVPHGDPVPEPSSILLLTTGAIAIGMSNYRRLRSCQRRRLDAAPTTVLAAVSR